MLYQKQFHSNNNGFKNQLYNSGVNILDREVSEVSWKEGENVRAEK